MADTDQPARNDGPVPKADIAETIETWFRDHMHDSPVSRHVEIWNYVRGAVDDLKRRIEQEG